jgi:predicted acetyltransferase
LHIELTKALLAGKPIVHNLSQFYLYEFSKYMPAIKLEEHSGLYDGLPDLDEYWDNPDREAFIIRVDGELAGFVLVIKGTADEPNQIGEFFVMEKFGGKGVGKTAAKRVFDMFPGNWLIHEMWNNYKAQAFWRSIVNSYTKGKYQEYYDEHRRPFQKFNTQELRE